MYPALIAQFLAVVFPELGAWCEAVAVCVSAVPALGLYPGVAIALGVRDCSSSIFLSGMESASGIWYASCGVNATWSVCALLSALENMSGIWYASCCVNAT